MYETLHINQRVRQRGITDRMIELTLEYGVKEYTVGKADKIKLGTKLIKKLLRTHSCLKSDLLKILDKGGLIVVISGSSIITAYIWYK